MIFEIITVILALQGAEEIDHITTTPYTDNFRKYDYASYGSQESIYDNSEDTTSTRNTESKPTIKTLSPDEIEEVKRAIQEMLPGHEENSFTQLRGLRGASSTPLPYNPYYQNHKHTRYVNESLGVFPKTPKSFPKRSNAHPYYPFYEMYTPQEIWETISFDPSKVSTMQQINSFHTTITKLTETTPDYYDSSSAQTSDVTEESVVVEKREADEEPASPSTEALGPDEESGKGDKEEPVNPTGEVPEEDLMKPDFDAGPVKPSFAEPEDEEPATKELIKFSTAEPKVDEEGPEKSDKEESAINNNEIPGLGDAELGKDIVGEPVPSNKRPGIKADAATKGEPTKAIILSSEDLSNSSLTKVIADASGKLAKKVSQKVVTTRRTFRRTTTKFQLDVPMLLQIIANLTYDYEMNLTDNLNETLLKLSIPTCGTPTTTPKPGTFIDYEANATGTIVAKCFVCGLEEEKVPRHAQCADAFAGDFLPLVPVDMTARGRISKYRKYCRYLDVPHYHVNSSMPRSVYGRWTGGCSVRWIDLSGVYTQRSCRNKERPVMGRHATSKRMAKLEMALNNMDDGCIVSPMATLVPLSRGISLYARFHACVCTGSWCNAAAVHTHWLALAPVLLVCVNAPS